MEPQHIVTRTRTIKPSVRLRQSPDPSKTRPATTEYPIFPLPHVALHPDDSASKVLLAIGRSFMSVDNKAMTIKDLSEMTMTMGYNCLNVSAASQAITTYIRAHLQRCEVQQDQPLLLKHVLSGTAADDDLLPALYSTCGGASSSTESRATNFRRGTVVWYLSRSTGAPCPFARAGIRLCDYVDLGASQTTLKKHIDPQQCGQKRKRRSTRECVLKNSALLEQSRESTRSLSPLSSIVDSEVSEDSDVSPDIDEPPPVKVKLTLKLPPLTRVRMEAALAKSPQESPVSYRRSPSVPYSVASIASPPPESDNEEEDSGSDDDNDNGSSTGREIDISMDVDDTSVDEEILPEDLDDDEAQFSDEWDDDNDEEVSTTWESPGPRSPSAQPPAFRVKEEPRDVQGLLDQWEYDLDLKEPLVKSEDASLPTWDWDWESGYHSYIAPSSSPSNNSSASMSPIQSRIKQEDEFDLSLSFSGPAFTNWRQSATLSPTTPFGFTFGDESDVFPISPSAFPISPASPTPDYRTLRPRARTVPSLSLGGFLPGQTPETPSRPTDPPITHSLSSLVHSFSLNPLDDCSPLTTFVFDRLSSEPEETESASELSTAKEQPPPCISPNDIRIGLNAPESVVVNTCEPCLPQIVATHVEGIAVYQSSLGPHTLLRRIDTDFVNLTPIIKYAQTPYPISAISGATTVTKGRQEVQGVWVPLEAMRLYAQDCITNRPSTSSPDPVAILDIFLSDSLVERFPTALREFVRTTRANLTNNGTVGKQFGKSFGGDSASSASPSGTPNPTVMAAAAAKDRMPIHEQPFFPPLLSCGISISTPPSVEVPLSATEEKIFDEFCVNLEWEKAEEGFDCLMDIEDALRTALPLMRTPERSTRTRSRARQVSFSPSSSPLSSCPPSPVLDNTETHSSAKLVTTTGPQVDATTSSPSSSSLRRSKRVADALAAKSNVRTRSCKRRSKNLS
ncbi:uncharacterized protein C8R40DRAFT_905653 [Lentinula edodes]|uniref:uncharacterized protein n=1 Tax=Lentinula edodes TaxID=5353 RepID=UPI001E8ECFE5|nr:uncharacterized protein C8R40DRAFT_905653 [Lentinula edodes]KAH7877599.1 hypothetical protein C8R40DRAFT_905653 [Lentinula edodes]